MQNNSAITRSSKSDDGIERPPYYSVCERKTISDDGFASFPDYCAPKAEDYEDGNEWFTDNIVEKAQITASPHQSQADEAVPEGSNAPKLKRKRRRPKNKKKGKSKAGDGRVGAVAFSNYVSPYTEDAEDEVEDERESHRKDEGEESEEAEEGFELRPEDILFMGAFTAMDEKQRKKEMIKLLEYIMYGE